MSKDSSKMWIIISLLSLVTVAVLGVIMRYKIAFSFPFLNQKNLQYAHSHFAFAGWITQTLFLFMTQLLKNQIPNEKLRYYENLLWANWITALGMLFSFMFQGYALYSILFSSLSIVISFMFGLSYWYDSKYLSNHIVGQWFRWAIFFMLLSTIGTFSLSFMMISRNIQQHTYLASVYWYLHFQYNGWFFFVCMGLIYNLLGNGHAYFTTNKWTLRLIGFTCIPAYGLSILWMKLPFWVEMLIAIAAVLQALGWAIILINLNKVSFLKTVTSIRLLKWFLIIIAIAGSIKFILQLGSTIPAVSQLAFGFRSIVIAYLHLVLLVFISLFLLVYTYLSKISSFNRFALVGMVVFVLAILSNELLLGIQGIASVAYILVPWINEMLFLVSLFILIGIGIILYSKFRKSY